MEKNILQTIFPNIKDLEKQAEAWDKLGLAAKMDLLAGATDKLSGMFEDAVTNSDKWQKAELKIKTAENNLAKLANQEKLLQLKKEVVGGKDKEKINEDLYNAINYIMKGSSGVTKDPDKDIIKKFIENDAMFGDWEFGDLFETMGLVKETLSGFQAQSLNANGLMNRTLEEFVAETQGLNLKNKADKDLAEGFLNSLEKQEKMSMTHKSMQQLFDKWFEKGQLDKKTKHMQSIVTGTEEKEVAVKEHKEDLANITNPNKKTGKDMMVKVQDAMVQADSGDEINFAPKGFFNGFTDVTAKVYDQLTSLYTAVTTMKKEELSRPAIVQALEAAPVSPVDNSNVTKAIDNLATAISDKPITVTIDGREVARTLYNQSMKTG